MEEEEEEEEEDLIEEEGGEDEEDEITRCICGQDELTNDSINPELSTFEKNIQNRNRSRFIYSM